MSVAESYIDNQLDNMILREDVDKANDIKQGQMKEDCRRLSKSEKLVYQNMQEKEFGAGAYETTVNYINENCTDELAYPIDRRFVDNATQRIRSKLELTKKRKPKRHKGYSESIKE